MVMVKYGEHLLSLESQEGGLQMKIVRFAVTSLMYSPMQHKFNKPPSS
jgi:hypothetical protein